MNSRSWTIVWPGLTGLALNGRFGDLLLAVVFSAALNFALLTTFVWPQLISRDLPPWGLPAAAWVLVLWFWVMGQRRAVRLLAFRAAKSLQPDEVSDTFLTDAQTEYLKGHWLEAKSLLVRLLSRRPGDAEARLLLASVYRRSGEAELAGEQLAELWRLPAAVRWQEEIEQEKGKLVRPTASGRDRESSAGEPVVAKAA